MSDDKKQPILSVPSFGINVISRKGPTISGRSLILLIPAKSNAF